MVGIVVLLFFAADDEDDDNVGFDVLLRAPSLLAVLLPSNTCVLCRCRQPGRQPCICADEVNLHLQLVSSSCFFILFLHLVSSSCFFIFIFMQLWTSPTVRLCSDCRNVALWRHGNVWQAPAQPAAVGATLISRASYPSFSTQPGCLILGVCCVHTYLGFILEPQ